MYLDIIHLLVLGISEFLHSSSCPWTLSTWSLIEKTVFNLLELNDCFSPDGLCFETFV